MTRTRIDEQSGHKVDFFPSFLSSFHPTIHPSVHPSISPSVLPSFYLSFLPSIHPSFISCLSFPSFHIVFLLFSLFLIFLVITFLLPFLSQSPFSYMALLCLSLYCVYHFPCYSYLTLNVAFLYLGDILAICKISGCPSFWTTRQRSSRGRTCTRCATAKTPTSSVNRTLTVSYVSLIPSRHPDLTLQPALC